MELIIKNGTSARISLKHIQMKGKDILKIQEDEKHGKLHNLYKRNILLIYDCERIESEL